MSSAATPAIGAKRIPFLLKFAILHLSTCRTLPLVKLIPFSPSVVPFPSIDSPRRVTTMFAPATLTALIPPEANRPAWTFRQSTVSDLVMVRLPKPPLSMQLISPPVAVLEIAPAKVLHGAVRLHGLASSPTPDTQVRVACACAGKLCMATASSVIRIADKSEVLLMRPLPLPD